MNIEQAKAIPLPQILEMIGVKPAKQRTGDLWYLSPLRQEKTPSLHVNTMRNIWFDFGDNTGGSTIDFVCAYLKSQNENHSITDALRWLRNMAGYIPAIPQELVRENTKANSVLTLKKVLPIRHTLLVRYLESRGIPIRIARKYLSEVTLYNRDTGKRFFALGFKNEDEGYELRNPFFKGSIRPKTITFKRGAVPKPDGIHLFEGFMDFLSLIAYRKGKPLDEDAIIMNSLSCMKDASAYIKNYGYHFAYTWLDNDKAGQKATEAFAEFFKTQEALEHTPMNAVYASHKDVNAWHVARLAM